MVIFGISAMGLAPPPEAIAAHGPFQSVSISKLFIAGFVPGVIMAGGLLVMNYIRCRMRGFRGSAAPLSARNVARACYQASGRCSPRS